MKRQYVHLSIDMETATKVAERIKEEIKILEVEALKAYSDGLSFYKEDNGIWLADVLMRKVLVMKHCKKEIVFMIEAYMF